MRYEEIRGFLGWIVIAAGIATVLGCGSKNVAAAPPPSAPPGESWLTEQQLGRVEVERVSEHEVGASVTTSAKIMFDDAHVTHVFTPVTGRVTAIHAKLGQVVKKGDALATIESPDLGSASADLRKAEADLTAAKHDVARKKSLQPDHAISDSEVEAADDNYLKAKAEVDRANEKFLLFHAGATDNVSQDYVLRSLIDGKVLARNVNPGAEVQGQYGGGTAVELFTIGTLDPVWAIADVFDVDLSRVHQGANVEVSVVAYPNRVFAGKVDWVADVIDPQTRTTKVRCTLPNAGEVLKPEMFATATIAASGKSAIAVKRSAVLRIGEQQIVYVREGAAPNGAARFVRKPVRVDDTDPSEFVPVQSGLNVGDLVVTKNAVLVSES